MNVYTVRAPGYGVGKKPDAKKIGTKIDTVIKRHFSGRRVAIRCLGSQEHRGKTADDLVETSHSTAFKQWFKSSECEFLKDS